MEGVQSGTYLRLTRVSSGSRVSIAKTYRDETKMKMNKWKAWDLKDFKVERSMIE